MRRHIDLDVEGIEEEVKEKIRDRERSKREMNAEKIRRDVIERRIDDIGRRLRQGVAPYDELYDEAMEHRITERRRETIDRDVERELTLYKGELEPQEIKDESIVDCSFGEVEYYCKCGETFDDYEEALKHIIRIYKRGE